MILLVTALTKETYFSLNSVQKILVVLEVVDIDMCLLLLRSHLFHNHNVLHFLTLWALMAKIIFARVLDMVLRRVLHFPQDWMWPSQAFISCFLLSTSLCPGSRVGSGLSSVEDYLSDSKWAENWREKLYPSLIISCQFQLKFCIFLLKNKMKTKVIKFRFLRKKFAQFSSCFVHLLSKRPDHEEDFFKFCVLLRKSKLYLK